MIHKTINILEIFFFISVFYYPLYANNNNDLINKQNLNFYLTAAENHFNSNTDSSLYYALKAANISADENLAEEFTEASILASSCYAKLNNIKKSKDILEKALRVDFLNENDSNKVNLLIKLGDINFDTGNYSGSLSAYNEALVICQLNSYLLKHGTLLNNIGIVHKFKGDYAEAIEYHLSALKIYENIKYNPGIAASLGNIGNVNESLNDYGKALQNYLRVLEISRELNDSVKIANSLMNIGVVYFSIDKKKEALSNFLTAYEIAAETDNGLIKSYCLNNIAYVQNDLGNYSESIKFYKKAYESSEDAGDKWGMANTLNNLASVYLSSSENQAALNSANDGLIIAEKINAKDLQLESYKILSEVHENNSDFSKSLEYFKLYKSMNDSLFAEENREKIIDANVKYDIEKKEKEINELKLTQQERIFIFSTVTISLLLIISAIFYFLYRQKRKSELFLKNILNSFTHPFIVYDVLTNSNELHNKAALESKSPYLKFNDGNNRHFFPYTADKIIETKKPFVIEFEDNINGERIFFECFGFPIINKKSEVEKIIEYAVDITDKKEAVNKIKSAFERERELNELKSNFISSTSHEFRTPLATLFSSVELIQHYDKTKSADKKLYHLGRIKDIVLYMTNMLDNILTINKADVDKIEFKPEIINIKSFCSEILEDIIISATDKHLIDQIFEGENENVFLDPNLLRQILTNLLSNAIKYSPDGGKILFKTEIQKNKIIFSIRDEGIGIPKEDIKNLYQYFFRAKNSKTISGTGLGLSIVKKSVEVHKGTIELTSNEGEGTTFVVTLPTDKSLVNITNSFNHIN
ncbi:MAG: tetratricopeptide repeat-containing sensor histidine kinase [Bacteroidetes bacterium]|nr:tetratricopeptide repeat-containing sensor histidine kinase [Bacteroidota bacterium]